MRKLTTAIIGLGRISWDFHIRQIFEHNGFELIAAVDPVEERRREAEQAFGVRNTFASTDELFAAMTPELVVVASPTVFHKEQIIQAFRHGCDVFSDKPLSLSLEETDEIFRALKAYGKKLMVYQPRRLDIDCDSVTKILDSGKLGRIYQVKRAVTGYNRRNDWQSKKIYGGGMLNNYGAHYIDQLLYVLKTEMNPVFCQLDRIASLGDADDVVKAIFKTANGITVELDINQACAQATNQWVLVGEYGSAFYRWEELCWNIRYFHPEDMTELKLQTCMAAENRQYSTEIIPWREDKLVLENAPRMNYYDKCYDYFALDHEPFVALENTREVMRLIGQCRAMA